MRRNISCVVTQRLFHSLVWFLGIALAASAVIISAADWSMLRGGPEHTGSAAGELQLPLHLRWHAEFADERLGTAMDPIVAEGRVFVATHAGNVHALDAKTGRALWRFAGRGPFLHSPAVAANTVVAADADGGLYALAANSGVSRWKVDGGHGGFAASPTIADGTAFIGTRGGQFLAVSLQSGKVLWRDAIGVPIRQTAAVADGRALVTGEDLRVRCWETDSGRLVWVSAPLAGQSARDYYPVITRSAGRTFVVVRTNPTLNMAQRIGRDRTFLCRNAGVDDSGWQKVDAWIKSPEARGNPQLWAKEQEAIVDYLGTNRQAQSFFIIDVQTGKESSPAPILWVGGCQGVGPPPVPTADGRLVVFYRSAYGNWNHGVAPLVALGLLDIAKNRIEPLSHRQGRQPPWNTFWGTADEAQNFVVAGNTVLIVHQGTLSGFDLGAENLFPIHGARDTYGGLRNPSWARNEWHGPARGGVAVSEDRVYWQTGSRVLCLSAGQKEAGDPHSTTVDGAAWNTGGLSAAQRTSRAELRAELRRTVAEILANNWAPCFVEPGLAGRDFAFDESGELFEALAWAFPHLPTELRRRAKSILAGMFAKHPPFAERGSLALGEGTAREWFVVPKELRARVAIDRRPHPFGGVYAAWLWAERCGERDTVMAEWPGIRSAFEEFRKSGWKLDGSRGDLFANRYAASLFACAKLADIAGDRATAELARRQFDECIAALVAWWDRAANAGTLTQFKGSGELDPFIGQGDALSFRIAPHRHKLALFQDLTPEVAALMRERVPSAVERLGAIFDSLWSTWWIVGEERQVHFGENYIDPSDLALNGFRALAWLRLATRTELASKRDIPFCRADLYYAMKIALALEAKR